MDDAHFRVWKEKFAPLLFDWFSHHNLTWPTQTCRWGPKVSENSYKEVYRMYFSEQTDDSEPQKLVVANMEVCKPHVASAEVVCSWTEFQKCPYVREHKVIFHPGEINKVREVPGYPQLVATHTDAPEVYLWNLEKQPARQRETKSSRMPAASVPDLVLAGHTAPAQFPLAASADGPHLASGGQDTTVLLWNLEDKLESLLVGTSPSPTNDISNVSRLQPRHKLEGHTNTIEDLVFMPGTSQQLVSVGDDHQVLLWDTRSGTAPIAKIEQAHGKQDIQCVDWNSHATNLIATGAQDGSLRVWDNRRLGNPKDHVFYAKCHSGGIIRLEWHPHERDVLASGGEDRIIMVWRLGPAAGGAPLPALGDDTHHLTNAPSGGRKGARAATKPPPELIFQHAGHRRGKVVDFQWHPHLPWTMLSVSDDAEDEEMGGGTLQVWRINDMIYRPEEEVVAELEAHREYILEGRNPPQVRATPAERRSNSPAATAAATSSGAGAAPGGSSAAAPADAVPLGTLASQAAAPSPAIRQPPGTEGIAVVGDPAGGAAGTGEGSGGTGPVPAAAPPAARQTPGEGTVNVGGERGSVSELTGSKAAATATNTDAGDAEEAAAPGPTRVGAVPKQAMAAATAGDVATLMDVDRAAA